MQSKWLWGAALIALWKQEEAAVTANRQQRSPDVEGDGAIGEPDQLIILFTQEYL